MQAEARRLGIGGWVRNREDGTVEAEFTGSRAALDALVAWAGRGPSGARVHDVVVRWDESAGEKPSDFSIRW